MSTMPKQTFKLIEIAINKFYDQAIPHHKNIYENHKLTTHKLATASNITQLNKEVKDKKRIIKQLKDLLYELDTLRAQVEDVDLDRFDNRTFSLRKTITALIKDYNAIEKQALILAETENNINENIENEEEHQFNNAVLQVQMQSNLAELKLQQDENRLNNVVSLENDIEDLHGIYVDLNDMVTEQGANVDQIETNVEATQENVNNGLQHLITASRLKKASYPLTGALLGSLVGGPLGMVAGFKIGGAAAIGCGVVGYASGRFIKNCSDPEGENAENSLQEDLQEDHNHIDNVTDLNSCDKSSNDKKDK